MFELDRTFCQRSPETGLMEWFFNAREGIYGPYSTKQRALKELNLFIKRNTLVGDDGGRSIGKNKTKLAILPLEFSFKPKVFDPTKRKKGIND